MTDNAWASRCRNNAAAWPAMPTLEIKIFNVVFPSEATIDEESIATLT
jgi:hypothetical protein